MSVEAITKEEMALATQPTRQEQIMLTPVEAVLAKDSWDDVDVEILIMHQRELPEEVRAKLGIVQIKPLSAEEVLAQTTALGPVAIEEVAAIAATVPTETVTEETVVEVTTPETVTEEVSTPVEVTTTELEVAPTVDNSQEESN